MFRRSSEKEVCIAMMNMCSDSSHSGRQRVITTKSLQQIILMLNCQCAFNFFKKSPYVAFLLGARIRQFETMRHESVRECIF